MAAVRDTEVPAAVHRHFRLPQAEQPTHPIGAPVAIELVEALEHVDLLVFEDLAAVRDTEVPAIASPKKIIR